MKPKRIQRKRTKGWKMPRNTIYVGRPTAFGNPFRVTRMVTRAGAAGSFCVWLMERSPEPRRDRIWLTLGDLRGKNLACWCPLPKKGEPDHCHAAVLLELANR